MDDESRVYSNGAMAAAADRIIALGHSSQIFDHFAPFADEIVDLDKRIVLPRFINTHVHTSQQLARGIADDVDLMTWLHERIWLYESNMMELDSYIFTLLFRIELIRSGANTAIYQDVFACVPNDNCIKANHELLERENWTQPSIWELLRTNWRLPVRMETPEQQIRWRGCKL